MIANDGCGKLLARGLGFVGKFYNSAGFDPKFMRD
jgi:hypothetical protein